ncbi:hypothetical protein DGMP_06740 [Desulfomarina profundi]|uniref:Uncharacterized protein n=1 Tax=Desulfomarina profundi TaxID=2772557 RepID=A0A8D5FRC0_9BACT|nr:hypothetical protein [Desulfomarina profundi]BCL59981.1 hypothetical protein DGMP_06740 [Desulfomarina profundi]
MIELLREYWAMVVGFFGIAIFQGRLSQRVKALEEKPECVPETVCSDRRDACQKMQEKEFAHGSTEFGDIKKLIMQVKRCSEEQHKMIMEHLLKMHE